MSLRLSLQGASSPLSQTSEPLHLTIVSGMSHCPAAVPFLFISPTQAKVLASGASARHSVSAMGSTQKYLLSDGKWEGRTHWEMEEGLP